MLNSPYRITQAGFQLSFLAVLGVAITLEILKSYEFSKKIYQSFFISLGIQLGTTPIILYHYFEIPTYSVILNIIVIPLMGLVLMSGISGIILSYFFYEIGQFSFGMGYYILRFYEWICLVFEKLPYANIVIGKPTWIQIIVYYIGVFLLIHIVIKKKKKMIYYILIPLFLGGLLLEIPSNGIKVTFLDVGQGDCNYIEIGNQNILIDGGSTSIKNLWEYRLEPYFKSKGVRTIEFVFVTHADQDHFSGILEMLNQKDGIDIEYLVLPIVGKNKEDYEEITEKAINSGTKIYWMQAGESLNVGEATLQCVFPEETDIGNDINGDSLVLELQYKTLKILFTGDMGEEQEKLLIERRNDYSLEQIQVLKIAHHGSNSSTGKMWLDYLNPMWATISCGEDNMYGHPHDEVLERMKEANVTWWQTDESGAITLWSDGELVRWTTFLKP